MYPSDAAHVAHAGPLAAANALDLTLRVRNCRADVRVMRNVGLTYETYDKENRGLYATIRHFAQPLDASSLASSTVAGKKHDGGGAVDGKLLSQSELCFRLHKSRLRTDKKDYESGKLLSQATFYFPDVQAAGTMKTRFNNMSACAHVPAHAPGDGASASAAGDPPCISARELLARATGVGIVRAVFRFFALGSHPSCSVKDLMVYCVVWQATMM